MKMSPNISGFQVLFRSLCSPLAASVIIFWKDSSPVLSFTHWMPFGENMENPDDAPAS